MSDNALLLGGLALGGGVIYLLSQQSQPQPSADITSSYAYKIYQALAAKFSEVEPQLESGQKTLYETENALAAELVRKAQQYGSQDSDYIERQNLQEAIIGAYTQYGIKVSPDDATLYMHVRQIPLKNGLLDPTSDHGHVGVRFRLVSNSRNYDQILLKSSYWNFVPSVPLPSPVVNPEESKAYAMARLVDGILQGLNQNAQTSNPNPEYAISQWTTATTNAQGTFQVTDGILSDSRFVTSSFDGQTWQAILRINNTILRDKKLRYRIDISNSIGPQQPTITWNRNYDPGLGSQTQAINFVRYFKGLYAQYLCFNATTAKSYLQQYANQYNEGSYTQIPITTIFGYAWQIAFSDNSVARLTALSLPPGIQVELKYPDPENNEFYVYFASEYFSYSPQTLVLGGPGIVEYFQAIYNSYRNVLKNGTVEGLVKGILPFTNSIGILKSSVHNYPAWYITFSIDRYELQHGVIVTFKEFGTDDRVALMIYNFHQDVTIYPALWTSPNWGS